MEKEIIIKCTNLEKKYFIFDKDYKIIPWLFTKKGCSKEIIPLTNINLIINKGDVIGFVGKNGAGKSTLMKIIAGITMHTAGGLTVNGKVNSLINLSAGFNQKYTGRQNIYYKALLMGMSKEDVNEIIDEIIDFCELGEYFDLPIYMYSSGMSARLGFALAIFAEHDILIVDEVFAVGDRAFKEKSGQKMKEILTSGKSIIFASHSDGQIKQFCNRAVFIDESQIVVDGTVDEVLNAYKIKYAPNKVKKSNNNINKFKNFNRFINLLKKQHNFDKADIYREIAIVNELENNFELAYKYMLYANYIRPKGKFILKKLKEYECKIGESYLNNCKIQKENLKNFNELFKYLKNNKSSFKKVDLLRNIALFYENEGNIEMAFKYTEYVKELEMQD